MNRAKKIMICGLVSIALILFGLHFYFDGLAGSGDLTVGDIDFHDVAIGTTATTEFKLRNGTKSDIEFRLKADCRCITVSNYEGTLNPGASIAIVLTLTPPNGIGETDFRPHLRVVSKSVGAVRVIDRKVKYRTVDVFQDEEPSILVQTKPLTVCHWHREFKCAPGLTSASIVADSASSLLNCSVDVTNGGNLLLTGSCIQATPGINFDTINLEMSFGSKIKLIVPVPVVIDVAPVVIAYPRTLSENSSQLTINLYVNDQCKDWEIEQVEIVDSELLSIFDSKTSHESDGRVELVVRFEPYSEYPDYLRLRLLCLRAFDGLRHEFYVSIPWITPHTQAVKKS